MQAEFSAAVFDVALVDGLGVQLLEDEAGVGEVADDAGREVFETGGQQAIAAGAEAGFAAGECVGDSAGKDVHQRQSAAGAVGVQVAIPQQAEAALQAVFSPEVEQQ